MDQKLTDFKELNSCCLLDPLDDRLNGSKEIMETIEEMSTILKTGLDAETLAICFKLLENGVNAEALAKVVIGLRKECDNTSNTSPFK